MGFYISTDNIKEAYEELIKLNCSNQSILHIFFILKGIGIDNLTYQDIDIIKQKGVPYTQDLGALFSDLEAQPEKCDFINPFMMTSWSTNPTEKLKKWVESRVKNNIIGGATTWRNIIMQEKDNSFKFVYDYVQQIKSLTIGDNNKIPLQALAIWCNRFTLFANEVSINSICLHFLERFNINQYEKSELFLTQSKIEEIQYDNNIYDTSLIRNLIGAPPNMNNWIIKKPITTNINIVNSTFRSYSMVTTNDISTELLKKVLEDYHQLILSGPPGTSKSFLCQSLSKNYDETIHIQFHPQYTYQQFVGGYYVNKSEVVFEKGIMLKLIDKTLNNNDISNEKKYLVIIDEINRANTSQVFGDLIQCLDRSTSVEIICDRESHIYSIPKNIHIIATMNSTDRTIGALDYALKRRFLEVYCGCNIQLIADLCPNINFIPLSDFLERLNQKLFENLKNREMCIGHAIFLNEKYKNFENGKYIWDFENFELLFNYKILPLIEEYCYGNYELLHEIIGENLSKRLSGTEFKNHILDFMK